jgi:hypothetical protein
MSGKKENACGCGCGCIPPAKKGSENQKLEEKKSKN